LTLQLSTSNVVSNTRVTGQSGVAPSPALGWLLVPAVRAAVHIAEGVSTTRARALASAASDVWVPKLLVCSTEGVDALTQITWRLGGTEGKCTPNIASIAVAGVTVPLPGVSILPEDSCLLIEACSTSSAATITSNIGAANPTCEAGAGVAVPRECLLMVP